MVTNEELQSAIDKTFVMVQQMECSDELMDCIEKHLMKLLDEQMVRVRMVEVMDA
jgi:hypothetical protein